MCDKQILSNLIKINGQVAKCTIENFFHFVISLLSFSIDTLEEYQVTNLEHSKEVETEVGYIRVPADCCCLLCLVFRSEVNFGGKQCRIFNDLALKGTIRSETLINNRTLINHRKLRATLSIHIALAITRSLII